MSVIGVPRRGTALVRPPSPALADGIVTHLQRSPVDVDRARAEHAEHVAVLAALLAASAPRTRDRLDDLGFDVVTVDIGELEKLEGCVTCLSVLVPDTGAAA